MPNASVRDLSEATPCLPMPEPPGLLLRVHWYGRRPGAPLAVRLWGALGDPVYTHVTLSINGCILWDQPWDGVGGWWDARSHLDERHPADTLALWSPKGIADVDVIGRRVEARATDCRGTVLSYLLGGPPAWNCASSVCAVLTHLGHPVWVNTPDQLWRSLRHGRS